MKSEDWVGARIGRLVITSCEGITKYQGGGRSVQFTFRCDCGVEFVAQKSNVLGRRTSCGCDKPKAVGTHSPGAWNDDRYKVWRHMIDRCFNPKCRSYADYGARGITVCERWLTGDGALPGFDSFAADIGPRPNGYTIERIDVNGAYTPDNCQWLPKREQSKNRRGAHRVTIDGETKFLVEWCELYGVKYFTAIRRLKLGWDAKSIFVTPVRGATGKMPA